MDDLNYWKDKCKSLESKEHHSVQDYSWIQIFTLLDVETKEDAIQHIRQLNHTISSLSNDLKCIEMTADRYREQYHQAKQINEQLRLTCEDRMALGNEALRDALSISDERKVLIQQLQQQINSKNDKIDTLQQQLSTIKIHPQVDPMMPSVDMGTIHTIHTMHNTSNTNIHTTDDLYPDSMTTRLKVLQDQIIEGKHRESSYSRQLSQLKRQMHHTTPQ